MGETISLRETDSVRVRRRDLAVLGQLRTLYNIGTISDLTDGQLLERFATDGEELAELAFSALVERHEAMVWRVCMAILRDEHEAEDAFQAIFLVLARKARSLWVRDSLGPWLHQVACRTASCLRTTIIRRRKHEQQSAAKSATRVVEVGTERDFDRDAAIHEEINRLPEKYRAPVVLCDLEGRTHQEAARFLGWPIGTVKSRQSQGRGLIRHRLARRGLGLGVAGVAAESLGQSAFAAMPNGVLQNTVNIAMQQSGRLLAASGASAHVLALSQGVLRAMLWTRVRFLAVAAVAVGIASGGAIVYVRGAQESAKQAGQPLPPAPKTATVQPKASKKAEEEPAAETQRAKLRAQQRATRKAKALYEIATGTRALAEIAAEEYQDVSYPQHLAAAEREIKLAEADFAVVEEHLKSTRRKFERNQLLPDPKSEELSLKRARFYVEQAQSSKKVLVDYTRDKNIKTLESEVLKAKSDELAKKATWHLEQSKEFKLERQLGLAK